MSRIILDKLKTIAKDSKDDFATSMESLSNKKKNLDPSNELVVSRHGTVSYYDREDIECVNDDYHIANVWVAKLRKLEPDQRLYAEKAINDILFQAQLGNLTKSSIKVQRPKKTSNSSQLTKFSKSPLSVSLHERADVPSEVVLSESFPNENCILSLDSDDENYSIKSAKVSEPTRNQTFIVAASPSTTRMNAELLLPRSRTILDKCCVETVSTNTSDCIISQLSRYLSR
ncbi:uncharacterized protein LOC142982581 isoform X2 [Anticarsia gemmatalis]|uniref:uncharacterized protein LOC142982581 isoform X2 n=1 Tax=Anticarsia gemmatalis TaxID=129554 RepID=UPI003F7679B8